MLTFLLISHSGYCIGMESVSWCHGCPEIDGSEGCGDNEFCKGNVFGPNACTEKYEIDAGWW